ncbi:CHAT domain-containing tetratricopeptide repeat protein [Synechococcus sp. PCC 6312]|uniref:CHAT domain-containing tetratricopeptide repeat protein n=1 Tax=Synechococcus sp. (strain ATCC 27167 / PCC 6312) TaxID=195253 RepID=UPI00029F39A9|nr:CHAT domain-containing tetratricopeptide repeat protein [Synechococcus sp. PCC 6312]AFY60595.1 hypothetical protein Syn6312_1425 [Synechococcus sp. PCC 6312]
MKSGRGLIAGLLLCLGGAPITFSGEVIAQVRPTEYISQSGGLAEANQLNEQAVKLYQQGRYNEALPLYQRSLAIWEKALGPNHPNVATGLNNLGALYQAQGNYAQALPLYQRSLAIREKALGPDHPDVAYSLNNLAALYQAQGNYAQALPLYQRSLTIWEKALGPDHLNVAYSLNNLAGLYQDQNNYPQALPLHQRSLAIRQKALGPDHPDVAISLHNLAALYQAQGNYAQALPLYQRSLAIREKALGPDHPDVAQSLNNLAALYHAQGNYAQALPLYQRGLAIREKALGPDHPDVANSLISLAVVYKDQGNYAQALPLNQRSLAIREKALGPDHPYVASSLNSLAGIYQDQGNYAQSVPLYQRSLAIREKALGPDHPDVATSLNNLAVIYKDQGNYAQALPLYQRSLAILEKAQSPNDPILAASLNNLAILYWANNTTTQSLPLFNRALNIEETNLAQNLVIGSEEYKRNYLKTFTESTNGALTYHLQAMPSSPEAAQQALTTILRRKGRVLDVLSNASLSLRRNLSPAAAQLLDDLSAIRTQIAQITFATDLKPGQIATLKNLQANADKIETELSQRSATFQAVTQPVTIAALQQKIPADAALIEFMQYQPFNPKIGQFQAPRYAAYILLPQGNVHWVDLGEAARLEVQLKEFMNKISDPRLPSGAVKPVARQTDALLLEPIRAKLGTQVKHLLIAPDAELNLIPFAALVDAQNRYLIETYQITYLTSGRDLLRPGTPSSNPPLIFANIDYDRPGVPSSTPTLLAQGSSSASGTRGVNQVSQELAKLTFGRLPNTGPEAEAIKALLPAAKIFTGATATENQLKASVQPLVLHLATHGFFQSNAVRKPTNVGDRAIRGVEGEISGLPVENPLLRSGLWLAGGNVRQSGKEDGILTALEVSGLDLQGTQLVVLSACQSGLGDVPTGEGVYGLRRAFVLAGAESQLSSLWIVGDAGTKELMIKYYENLLRGQGRGEALRQAQLSFVKGTQYNNTYYWAAFIPTGEWGPMRFSGNRPR